MSKDFEQAYKELVQSEIPDLWDRIEAGLSEKSTPEKKEEIPSEKKKKIYFRRYTGMAAAVLCVALIVPAALFLGQQGQKSSYLEMAEDHSGAETSSEVTECAPEEGEGVKADREPYEATAGGGEFMTETAADAGEDTVQDMAAVEESVSNIMEDEEKKMENRAQSAEAESLSAPKQRGVAELEDGAVIEKVTADVIEGTAQLDDNENVKSMGIVYTAVVLKDEAGCFEEGQQIAIFVPVYSSAALIEGSIFEVDLIYREDAEYPFELKAIR